MCLKFRFLLHLGLRMQGINKNSFILFLRYILFSYCGTISFGIESLAFHVAPLVATYGHVAVKFQIKLFHSTVISLILSTFSQNFHLIYFLSQKLGLYSGINLIFLLLWLHIMFYFI